MKEISLTKIMGVIFLLAGTIHGDIHGITGVVLVCCLCDFKIILVKGDNKLG